MSDEPLVTAPRGPLVRRTAERTFPRRWALATGASTLGVLLPLFVRVDLAAYVGVGSAAVLYWCAFHWFAAGGTESVGLDGTLLTCRTVRGMRSFDLARLHAVHGQQLRSRGAHVDTLVLHDAQGGGLSLVSRTGFGDGRDLTVATLHVAHGRVRELVRSGRVDVVTPGACAVLRLPADAARPGPLPVQRGAHLLALAGMLAGFGVFFGYTELLRALHG